MEPLASSVVEHDDVATAARFVLLSKRGDTAAAADFLRRTLAEVDGSALDLTTLSATLGYDLIGADVRTFADGMQGIVPMTFLGDDIDKQTNTLVLLIPGDMHIVGHLIGKGGLEIGKIETESGASVKIEAHSQVHSNVQVGPNSNNLQLNERVVTVTGSVISCVRAQRLLDRRLRARLESDGIHREVLRIIVPNDFVRHLIGKNGCNISQLQAQTGIRIQVQAEANMAPHQLGRVVTFQGGEHGRALAQYFVSRQLAEGPFRDWPNSLSQPTSPTTSAAWPPSPQLDYFSNMDPSKHLASTGHNAVRMDLGSSQSYANPSSYSDFILPQEGFAYRINDQQETIDEGITNDAGQAMQLVVPNPAVAYLIGKGGSTVTDMEAKSGARIRISKQNPGDSARLVSIKGSPQAVRIAHGLVQSRIEAYLHGHNNNAHSFTRPIQSV